jgi:prepilin-type processing-associated H-X9-DG protein
MFYANDFDEWLPPRWDPNHGSSGGIWMVMLHNAGYVPDGDPNIAGFQLGENTIYKCPSDTDRFGMGMNLPTFLVYRNIKTITNPSGRMHMADSTPGGTAYNVTYFGAGKTYLINKRHNHTFNALFVDTHVENMNHAYTGAERTTNPAAKSFWGASDF